jgi:uncharacterized membrane protein YphA (DoxX/SURF4 family)
VDRLAKLGYVLFAIAMIALGVETLALAFVHGTDKLGHGYDAIPVLPFLPPMPWLAYLVSAIWIVCGIGLLRAESARNCATILGSMLLVFALFLDAPRAAAHFASISLRTVVFEVIALASLAWMVTGRSSAPALFTAGRYLFALSLIVFGVDHYLALAPIAALIPGWIPGHVFWVAFFGTGLIAAGIAISIGYLAVPAAALIGLMYAIWVITLHLPRTLGFYGIPGAVRDPGEWSSLFIAVALWGGSWALVAVTGGGAGALESKGDSAWLRRSA